MAGPFASAYVSDVPQSQIKVLPNPNHPDFCLIELPTVPARTYFLKYSFNLSDWIYFPFIEKGEGTTIRYDFRCSTPEIYLAAEYTDLSYSGSPTRPILMTMVGPIGKS